MAFCERGARGGDLFWRHDFVVTQSPVDGLVDDFDVREQTRQLGLRRQFAAECIDFTTERGRTGGEFGAFRIRQRDARDGNTCWRRGRGGRALGKAAGSEKDGGYGKGS